MRYAYEIFKAKLKKETTRKEDNDKMDITQTGHMVVDWIHLPEDRV
jgi:hypothetical protein